MKVKLTSPIETQTPQPKHDALAHAPGKTQPQALIAVRALAYRQAMLRWKQRHERELVNPVAKLPQSEHVVNLADFRIESSVEEALPAPLEEKKDTQTKAFSVSPVRVSQSYVAPFVPKIGIDFANPAVRSVASRLRSFFFLKTDPAPVLQKTQTQTQKRVSSAKKTRLLTMTFLLPALLAAAPIFAYQVYRQAQESKMRVTEDGKQAFASFTEARQSLEIFALRQANQSFLKASVQLASAQQELGKLPAVAGIFSSDARNKTRTVSSMIDLGTELSKSGRYLTLAFAGLEEGRYDLASLSSSARNLALSADALGKATDQLKNIDASVISEHDLDLWRSLKNGVPLLREYVVAASSLFENILRFAGADSFQRYLIVFQNPAELRATGGFLGGFAVADFSGGELSSVQNAPGGFYDLQGSFYENIEPPKPLTLLNPRWEIQDSNWWPDFSVSADVLADRYESAAGRSVDGVIALNATILPGVLEKTGPIELPMYQKTFTADNVLFELQKAVELEYDREKNRPKEIVGELMSVLIKKINEMTQSEKKDLALLAVGSLDHKDIQMWFTDEHLEQTAELLNWAGRQTPLEPKQDYLLIAHSNIGGQKTDAVMQNSVRYTLSAPDKETKLVATLQITRQHEGKRGELFYGARNVDYLRVYTPKDSVFLSADGFDVLPDELFETTSETLQPEPRLSRPLQDNPTVFGMERMIENDKHVFGNFLMTDPGETSEEVFSYQLPWSLNDLGGSYELVLQKQSGIADMAIELVFDFPKDVVVVPASQASEEVLRGKVLEKDMSVLYFLK